MSTKEGVSTIDATRLALRGNPAARIQLLAGTHQVKVSKNLAKLTGVESMSERVQRETLRPFTESINKSLATILAGNQPKTALASQLQTSLVRDFTAPLTAQIREIYSAPLRDAITSVQKVQAAQFEPLRRILEDVARPVVLPRHDWFNMLDLSTALIRPAPSPVRVQQFAPARGLADATVADQVLRFLDTVEAHPSTDETAALRDEVDELRAQVELLRGQLVHQRSDVPIHQDVTVMAAIYTVAYQGIDTTGLLTHGVSGTIGIIGMLLTRWADRRFR
jgi:hypothetical protein